VLYSYYTTERFLTENFSHARTNEHIRAHFLTCFIALTLIRLWQYKVLKFLGRSSLNTDGWEEGITAESLKKSWNEFRADRLSPEYYKVVRPNDVMQLLLSLVGADCCLKYPKECVLRNLKSKIADFLL